MGNLGCEAVRNYVLRGAAELVFLHIAQVSLTGNIYYTGIGKKAVSADCPRMSADVRELEQGSHDIPMSAVSAQLNLI